MYSEIVLRYIKKTEALFCRGIWEGVYGGGLTYMGNLVNRVIWRPTHVSKSGVFKKQALYEKCSSVLTPKWWEMYYQVGEAKAYHPWP